MNRFIVVSAIVLFALGLAKAGASSCWDGRESVLVCLLWSHNEQ